MCLGQQLITIISKTIVDVLYFSNVFQHMTDWLELQGIFQLYVDPVSIKEYRVSLSLLLLSEKLKIKFNVQLSIDRMAVLVCMFQKGAPYWISFHHDQSIGPVVFWFL